MFHTLLIANRGEIACRVIHTARRMGIRTVAVHSDADANAAHVRLADAAVHIGGAAPADSYLRADAIIAAALAMGAEAIHPGYGFLSENPEFVEAVTAAQLTFIGPSAAAIRAMGLKDAAKTLMQKAGVPIVPGYHGADQSPARLADEAAKIGYPVLIKARAGGGGKGMRLVQAPADFPDALASAQSEGLSSFGDAAVLVEKYVNKPRHIEIQVFGDAHGNTVHLFERDCSLQRRHQKVIEEAPAPGMTPEMRAAMGRAAVEAARAVHYQGAGTVEFIVDGTDGLRPDRFWFMEMNTRLQVEHPVSEAITGLDFVELQLHIAAGNPLPFAQSDLHITGHAFEARLYAEDVPKGFLPATGRLDHLTFPPATAFTNGALRIDSGVGPGDDIAPWYDPMIAKVITHGPTRAAALQQLNSALESTQVAGSVTNLAFLAALSRHPGFAAGDVDTGLIARDLADLLPDAAPDPSAQALAALLATNLLAPSTPSNPWEALTGWRHWGAAQHDVTLLHHETPCPMAIEIIAPDHFNVNGTDLHVTTAGGTAYDLATNGQRQRLHAVRHGARITVFIRGQSPVFDLPDPLSGPPDSGAGGDTVTAPMPGLVKQVRAAPGQFVTQGDPLIVLEAMKMEHTLTAPRDGTVAELLAAPGDQVSDGTLLLRLDPENG